ncbi:RibD family protein [Variovorax sp. J22P168]|uniref:RibD family protein n=1 Tax=Variovorax jilinensis TaxID=3053513 RepID=UPI002576645B|nr:RibD family protein [Variovorax sp. J22P168]MDM0012799.1 RibD family protein [Variovorax sp. J22P168]
MMPSPASTLPGIDALWPLCLDIAARRRGPAAPPPAEAGGPIAWSEARGFELQGLWGDEAIELFELLKPLLDRPRPGATWTLGQLGQSLDGCVATHGGDSNFVNGPEMLVHLHRLRALCDAVIVGAGTAAIDDPQLTTRRVEGPNPVRVVIDPDLRLPATLRVLSDRQAPTLLACDARRADAAASRIGPDQVLGVTALMRPDGSTDLRALQTALGQLGLHLLFVEGGGVTVSRFIAEGCMDRLHLSIAPVLIGSGRLGLQLPRQAAMRDCPRPATRIYRMGADVLWDLDLRAAAG